MKITDIHPCSARIAYANSVISGYVRGNTCERKNTVIKSVRTDRIRVTQKGDEEEEDKKRIKTGREEE